MFISKTTCWWLNQHVNKLKRHRHTREDDRWGKKTLSLCFHMKRQVTYTLSLALAVINMTNAFKRNKISNVFILQAYLEDIEKKIWRQEKLYWRLCENFMLQQGSFKNLCTKEMLIDFASRNRSVATGDKFKVPWGQGNVLGYIQR